MTGNSPPVPRQRGLSLAQQYARLSSSPLTKAGCGRLAADQLVWEVPVRPSSLGREYRLRIKQPRSGAPRVTVESPDLAELAHGRAIPHVYTQTHPVRLCLWLPGSGEWTSECSLVDTVVQWAVLWLFYFEDWLAANDWAGGGVHFGVKDEGEKKSSVHRRWWR